ncbi:AraC family transcriptional regulator [Erwinia sp. OLTSP20]|uniref:helix-turn-helix domain-containing protein n=1 Tax=unclassified Erwinia TaxID=2622719 RepID=UPI000C17D724|nr:MULTISPECIES: helix-turn-helix domain-containing protein [unclassified Erwinia]PIJ49525.1 AraC family transcriptional regulator [Erwinia sp. OAMSP11]PIJ71191.1 AraC family transcriptional regulator [Erwinia sp. OLSSP12]PIJ79840.1 AraC family transcriptional regulator [Erwinia sp. OLCASP19]PIJ81603.1 AraC family transcriptional regulator [Erwinia sp. OLMTSP26]PIJ84018.1 AraC family transcriptional regulator [Erwinia sp. OLMDSP33]
MNHHDFIDDLVKWIDGHIEGKMDLDSVAERAGYSKWHLQRMFKQYTGRPLGEYIRGRRLKKSAERLAGGAEPILDVAISFGFDSQQSFNRSFKRQFGQSPGAWRRQARTESCQTN